MVQKIKKLLDDSHNFYNLICGMMIEITDPIKQRKLKNEDLVDIGFFCREMENMFNELRKEVKARKELCGSIAAYNLTRDAVQDPTIRMAIEGKYATGTPDVKMQAALPRKDSDEYFKFCKQLGVPEEIIRQGILKLDWDAVTNFCTERLADGLPIPDGLGKKYPQYVMQYRRKGQTDDEEN